MKDVTLFNSYFLLFSGSFAVERLNGTMGVGFQHFQNRDNARGTLFHDWFSMAEK